MTVVRCFAVFTVSSGTLQNEPPGEQIPSQSVGQSAAVYHPEEVIGQQEVVTPSEVFAMVEPAAAPTVVLGSSAQREKSPNTNLIEKLR